MPLQKSFDDFIYRYATKNIILVIILFYLIINYNDWTLRIIVIVIILYNIIEVYLARNTNYGRKMRIYKCLSDTSDKMINHRLQDFPNNSDIPLKRYYINTSNKSFLPC
jgi:c-di-AMP phosphodiesterase-like protein